MSSSMLRSVIPNSGLARAANLLMDLYGPKASAFAATRSKALLDQDDLNGAMAWLRVFAALEGLTRDQPTARTTIERFPR